MLLSGRKIQTTCPAGFGSPSLGAGSLFPPTTTVGGFKGSESLASGLADGDSELRFRQLVPDRSRHSARIRAGVRSHRLDARATQHAVVGVPAEDLRRKTGPRGRGSRLAKSSSSVTLYDRYGSRVRRCCCIARASRRDCSPFSGETMLSVMNAR